MASPTLPSDAASAKHAKEAKKAAFAKACAILGLPHVAASAKHSKKEKSSTEPSVLHSAAASSPLAVGDLPCAVDDAIVALASAEDVGDLPCAVDDAIVALEHADITDQIRARAAKVSEMGEWTSLFDWLVYAYLRKRRVHLCFGAQVVDIVRVFAPWLEDHIDGSKQVVRALGCVIAGGKLRVATTTDGLLPQMNHWVIGVPVANFCIDVESDGASKDFSFPSMTDAAFAAGKVGWRVKETEAKGNCGVDAMTYSDNKRERNEASFKALRDELSKCMTDISTHDLWHDCFKACQEAKLKPKVAHPKPSSSTLASSSSCAEHLVGAKLSFAAKLKRKAAEALGVGKSLVHKAVCLVVGSKETGVLEAGLPPGIEIPHETTHTSFFDWFTRGADAACVVYGSASYAQYERLREAWKAQHPPIKAVKPEPKPRAPYRSSKKNNRRKVANQYAVWRAGVGKNSNKPQRDFMLTIRTYKDNKVSRADTQWLRRLIQEFKKEDAAGAFVPTWGASLKFGKGTTVPAQFREKTCTTQGRNILCPDIDELLWDWFVDMRRSFATTVSPKYVLNKAKHFANMCLEQMEVANQYMQMPVLDFAWLWRWKRRHGVVWRKPNCKFKISWGALKVRCAATWLNVQRVQQLAKRVLGRELPVEGIDEKPIHLNEGGSKDVRTLAVVGEDDVELRRNHSHTRERATIMTSTTSDLAKAEHPSRLPIELMKKAGSARPLKGIKLPNDMSASVTWAPKGSYRHDDILGYIQRWCEEWTEARAAANDYRIMLLDVARSHIGKDIVDELWSRGYLCLYHYGGTTGVIQVNDTDNHGQFEREYLVFEEASFIRRQRIDPSDIGRDFQEVVDDAIATWKSIDHVQCARGYKYTGLTVALPEDGEEQGPEDDWLCRAAARVWEALGMPKLRRQALDEVNKALDDAVAAGETLSMSLWRSLVQHPAEPIGPGVMPEGFEFEGELLPGENPWIEPSDQCLALQDEAVDASVEPDAACIDFGEELAPDDPLVKAVESEEPAVVEEATLAAREVAKCERLRAWAVSMKLPFAAREAVRAKMKILKRNRPKTATPQLKAQLLLRRHLRDKLEKEHASMEQKRQAAREHKEHLAKIKAAQLEKAALAKLVKEKKEEDAKLLAKLPRSYSAQDCGNGIKNPLSKPHQTNRQNALERIKLRAPKLPPAMEVQWEKIRNNYCRQMALYYKDFVGGMFVREINQLVKDMGKYLVHPDEKVPKDSVKTGDPKAFENFVEKMRTQWPELKSALTTPLL